MPFSRLQNLGKRPKAQGSEMGREKGKDEEIVGATRNTLRETTGALRGKGPWHSAKPNVYHNNPTVVRPATASSPRASSREQAATPLRGV